MYHDTSTPTHPHKGKVIKVMQRVLVLLQRRCCSIQGRSNARTWDRSHPMVRYGVNTSNRLFSAATVPQHENENVQPPSSAIKSELKLEMSRFQDYFQGARNSESNSGRMITSQDCYHLLERWMQFATEERDIEAAKQAERLLQWMTDHTQSQEATALAPTSLHLDLVLQAYANCYGGVPAAERAADILHGMTKGKTKTTTIRPKAKSFHIVMTAWINSKSTDAGPRVEELYDEMMSQEDDSTKPNIRSLTAVVEAWAGPSRRHGKSLDRILTMKERATTILSQDQELSHHIQPDLAFFHVVMSSVIKTERDRRKGALTVMGLLHELQNLQETNPELLLTPTTHTYSIVLHAWAQCESNENNGDAAAEAERLLKSMVELYRSGLPVKPNLKCFSTCISAWGYATKLPDAPERAQKLLHELQKLNQETKDEDFHLDVRVGNAVLSAVARSRRQDVAERTLEALEKMKEFTTPDTISYNSCIYAYGKAKMADKALDLLEWMKDNENLAVRPDIVSYNNCIRALSSMDGLEAALKAQGLLEELESLSETRLALKPTKVTFTTIISAWRHSGEPAIADHVFALTNKMADFDVRCDEVTLKAAIQAYSFERSDKLKALQKATTYFQAFCDESPKRLTESAFVTILHAVNRLATSREEWIEYGQPVVDRCRSEGYVSKKFLSTLREKLSHDTMNTVLGCAGTDELPRDWSRSIMVKHRPYHRLKVKANTT